MYPSLLLDPQDSPRCLQIYLFSSLSPLAQCTPLSHFLSFSLFSPLVLTFLSGASINPMIASASASSLPSLSASASHLISPVFFSSFLSGASINLLANLIPYRRLSLHREKLSLKKSYYREKSLLGGVSRKKNKEFQQNKEYILELSCLRPTHFHLQQI